MKKGFYTLIGCLILFFIFTSNSVQSAITSVILFLVVLAVSRDSYEDKNRRNKWW